MNDRGFRLVVESAIDRYGVDEARRLFEQEAETWTRRQSEILSRDVDWDREATLLNGAAVRPV